MAPHTVKYLANHPDGPRTAPDTASGLQTHLIMLKRFFFNLLSSFVGAWIALVLFVMALVISVVGFVGALGAMSGSESASLKKHSVLKLDLSGIIEETETNAELDYISLLQGNVERPKTLRSLVEALKEAKANKNIDVLYIECNGVSASLATVNALREAVADFKKSGKPVYAYGDNLSTADYFIASQADSLFLNPGGELHLSGLSGTTLYMKGLFDKLGVQFQVIKVGTFKSAVEPYILNEMSGPARAQLDTLYGNLWNYVAADIARTRQLKAGRLNELMADGKLMLSPAKDLVAEKLVDRVIYKREINHIMARLTGCDADEVNYVEPSTLTGATLDLGSYTSSKQIAVLYATGDIAETPGAGINCEKLVPEIVKLADDKNVKGLVLRVNSPGGSVFGSEQIGEALDYFKSTGKPFAVSMGDYAASGGYWISCTADRIFADPLTITGSIGIFGLLPNVSGLASKVGVNPQTVSTNPSSDYPTLFKPLDDAQLAQMQLMIERGYDQFITRVATGRKMSKEEVKRIAEGRVWDAQTALKIKLVDQLGSLADAAKWVAKKADMKADDYDVVVYPQFKQEWLDMILSNSVSLPQQLTEALQPGMDQMMVREAQRVLSTRPAQARMMPFRVRF